jgi:branched-chain amino acid transport system substrate-binding protein
MAISGSTAQYTDGQLGMEVAESSQSATGSASQSYAENYQKHFKEKPRSVYGSYAYDSMMLAAAAINTAKSAQPADMISAMQKIAPSFTGLTGTLNLDADNQRQTQPYLKVKALSSAPVTR